MSELANEYKIVHRRLAARGRIWCAAIAFGLGAGSGVFWATSISPSCATPPQKTISGAILGIGEHLCRSHEGLTNVARLEDDVYAFTCRELAEFPRVPITLADRNPS